MAFRIYDFISAETAGIAEAAKAVVEANYWAEKAREAGWEVTFGADTDGIDVSIVISRDDFPAPQPEAEAG